MRLGLAVIAICLFQMGCATVFPEIHPLQMVSKPGPIEIIERLYNADDIEVEYKGVSCRVKSWDDAFRYLTTAIKVESNQEIYQRKISSEIGATSTFGEICEDIKKSSQTNVIQKND